MCALSVFMPLLFSTCASGIDEMQPVNTRVEQDAASANSADATLARASGVQVEVCVRNSLLPRTAREEHAETCASPQVVRASQEARESVSKASTHSI